MKAAGRGVGTSGERRCYCEQGEAAGGPRLQPDDSDEQPQHRSLRVPRLLATRSRAGARARGQLA